MFLFLLACDAMTPKDTEADSGCTPAARFADADGDGFGDPGAPIAGCEGDALAADATDCDDADGAVFPGAEERCNAADDDCDGVVDEEVALTWYVDADGDGFGADTVLACDSPEGTVEVPGDCDDTDPEVHPGAVERCATAADDDCDGTSSGAVDCVAFHLDADADGYGVADSQCLCAGDGAYTANNDDDCDDADPDVNPGAAERWDRVDQDCDGEIPTRFTGADAASLALTGEVYGDRAASSISAGDVDGDGVLDLLVGALFSAGTASADAGGAYLVLGRQSGTVPLGTADTRMPGADANDLTGYDVATGGDIDGDGLDEMIVGAMWAGGSSNPGEIYLFFGLSAPPATVALADADALWTGEPNETAGHGLAFAGDLDGDGLADVVTGAPGRDTPAINGGGGYVLLDPGAGGAMSDGGVTLVPESADDAVGEAVNRAGDLDGDGVDDLVIGARGDDDGAEESGATYVVFGPLSAGSLALASADAKITGDTLRSYTGNALATGDANGDGVGDLLIGSREYTVVSPFVALVHGPFVGTRSIATAAAVFEGVDREGLGASLAFSSAVALTPTSA